MRKAMTHASYLRKSISMKPGQVQGKGVDRLGVRLGVGVMLLGFGLGLGAKFRVRVRVRVRGEGYRFGVRGSMRPCARCTP